MKNISFSFDEIIERLKILTGLTKDSDVARSLGVQPNRFGTWRTRDSIPFEEIAALCNEKRYSINYVLFGQGPLMVPATDRSPLSIEERLELAELQMALLHIILDKNDVVIGDPSNERLKKEVTLLRKVSEFLQRF